MDNKTSTFSIHHDRCEPEKWTATDLLAFAQFVKTGNLACAARLARLGVQLVRSQHHEPKGGHLEHIGFCDLHGDYASPLDEVAGDEDVTPVMPLYRGPVEYAVRIPIGDEDGYVEGYEYEVKQTEVEAHAYFDDAPVAAD